MFKRIGCCVMLACAFSINLGCYGENLESPETKKTGQVVEDNVDENGRSGITAR